MPYKPKQNYKGDPEMINRRDMFRTPRYAVDLLRPYIPPHTEIIWEPAAGQGNISIPLEKKGYKVYSSDIVGCPNKLNFLTDMAPYFLFYKDVKAVIVTNPPFSLKEKFYYRCLELRVPFALLIPADYSAWVIDAVRSGAEKIIPTRRVDYITPDVVNRINAKLGTDYEHELEIPNEILAKFSSSKFHSMWLTKEFNIGRTETFVELSLKDKKEHVWMR